MSEIAEKAAGAPVAQVEAGASGLQVMKAVMWSFIGIRKRSSYENDVAKIKPAQAIIAGIIGAALFVAVLVTLVTFLTAK